MSANIHTLGGTNQLPPKRTVLSISTRAAYRYSCDELGMCHHTNLNCDAGTCHRALLDDGIVDIALPATPAPMPDAPDLLDVTSPPTRGELIWFWFWVAMTYAGVIGIGLLIYFFFSDAAARAFWRVVGYFG